MGSDKKQELLGIKLKNGILIGKKANKTTPSPSWKLGFQNSSSLHPNFSMNNSVSARKIGANLWEVQPQFNFNKDDGDHGGGGLNHHRRRRHHSREKEGFRVSDQLDEESVTPYVCAVTPTGYSIKPSTHLLKILNRIWNLEERHSTNVVLIKSLKRELEISQAQITTLVEERKRDHRELDELKKSTHERRKKGVGSTRDDEISDIRSSLIRETKARILLESLCDEFAKGIRDYDRKTRFLQRNCGKNDRIVTDNEPDRLMLHVSEAWLDERTQMKRGFSEKTSISDNLCCEIETFLEAKKKQSHGSEVQDDGVITEPSSRLVSRMTDHGPGAVEPSSKSMSRNTDNGPEVAEPSSRRARASAKANTLMAKLLEARLESQFSKSRTVRR